MEAQILAALENIFNEFGWFGVAVLLAFESATGFSPSDIILGLAGWMLLASHNAPPWMILVAGLYASSGSVFGASLSYWVFRLGGRPVIDRLKRWIRQLPRYVSLAEAQFGRWGPGLVLFGRMLPGIRILVTIPAGLVRMPFQRFLLFTFIGSYVYSVVFIGLGYILGHEWKLITELIKLYTPWFIAGFIFLAVLVLSIRYVVQQRLRLMFSVESNPTEE